MSEAESGVVTIPERSGTAFALPKGATLTVHWREAGLSLARV